MKGINTVSIPRELKIFTLIYCPMSTDMNYIYIYI